MTARARFLVAGTGLCALLAFVVHADRRENLAAEAMAAQPSSCSSCDARHASLRAARIAPLEVQE